MSIIQNEGDDPKVMFEVARDNSLGRDNSVPQVSPGIQSGNLN